MIKPYHILKLNAIGRRLGLRTFVARIYGNWFAFQDGKGSTTPEIVFGEISRGYYTPQRNLEPGMVVVDLGAHVGMFSIPLAKLHPEVSFICVEPDTQNFKNLVYNIRRAGVENVLPLHMGLWSSECELKSTHYEENTGGSHSKPVDCGECPGMMWGTFRKKFGLERIDLLKMDIEGAEFQIIRDQEDLKGVQEVLAEIHGLSGDAVKMVELIENSVYKTRLQVIHAYTARENGRGYKPRKLENYCRWCGSPIIVSEVKLCPVKNSQGYLGYNCLPS